MQPNYTPKLWAVLPAAGSGSRFSKDQLKQYQKIADKTVLEYSIEAVYQLPLAGCLVGISAQDQLFQTLPLVHSVQHYIGGKERMDTVLAALAILSAQNVHANDYVLVHDAARPCLHPTQIQQIIDFCQTGQEAAILAIPVRDTLKRADTQSTVIETVPRDNLWQAQTPQIAQFGLLYQALTTAKQQHLLVTDEASALEQLGYPVRLLAGRSDNIKITYPEDLPLAEQILRAQSRL